RRASRAPASRAVVPELRAPDRADLPALPELPCAREGPLRVVRQAGGPALDRVPLLRGAAAPGPGAAGPAAGAPGIARRRGRGPRAREGGAAEGEAGGREGGRGARGPAQPAPRPPPRAALRGRPQAAPRRRAGSLPAPCPEP